MAGAGAEAGASLRMAGRPEGRGLAAVVNAGQTRLPALGLPQSKMPVWVLKQELRLEILQWVPLWWGGGCGGGGGWEEHDFLFRIKTICGCRCG